MTSDIDIHLLLQKNIVSWLIIKYIFIKIYCFIAPLILAQDFLHSSHYRKGGRNLKKWLKNAKWSCLPWGSGNIEVGSPCVQLSTMLWWRIGKWRCILRQSTTWVWVVRLTPRWRFLLGKRPVSHCMWLRRSQPQCGRCKEEENGLPVLVMELRFCCRCSQRLARCHHLNVVVCEAWPQCVHLLDDFYEIQDRWSFTYKNKTWYSVGGDSFEYRLLIVSPCGLVEIYGRYGGTYYFSLYSCALKMEANVPANFH